MPATKLTAAIGPPNAATSRGAGRVDVMAAPSSEAGTRPPRTGGRTGPANVDPPPPAPSCERQHRRNRLRARRRWKQVGQVGGHRQYKHPDTPRGFTLVRRLLTGRPAVWAFP